MGGDDLRNRAGREDQEGAVQDGQARAQGDDDGTVERSACSLSPNCTPSTKRSLTDFTFSLSLHQSRMDNHALALGHFDGAVEVRIRGTGSVVRIDAAC